MVKLQVILGSTRAGRAGEAVADWVYEIANQRDDLEVELVDIAEYKLPLLDEPMPPMMRQYTKEHTQKWSEKIDDADGYIFVAAEYNHSVAGGFKNAIDYLNHEWRNKSVGFVSYGSNGGSRAVEHLRGIAGELHLADVREQLLLYLGQDFENFSKFQPAKKHELQLNKVLDQVTDWAEAMQSVRKEVTAATS
jgi:NAD(P)H-dependent FMN reductase